jgi:amino acid adenylation domain-containing protein
VNIYQLFEHSAQKHADSIALSIGEQHTSYTELEILTQKIVSLLTTQNIKAGDVVGICLKRSPQMVASVLAVLKIGATYLPLDSEYPVSRLKYMAEHSGIKTVLTQKIFASLFNTENVSKFFLDEINFAQVLPSAIATETINIDLAYVIYTSGSTGNPKGVAMPHSALVNLINWQNKQTQFAEKSVTLQFTPLSFDVHFQEIFSTLSLGGRLVLISEDDRLDPLKLLEVIRLNNVNRMYLPYVALNHICEMAVKYNKIPFSLREVTTAGEQLKITQSIRDVFEQLEKCKLFNHYGPSESHVVTSLTLDGAAKDWPALPSIGQAIDYVQVHILDEKLNSVADGVQGELYLAGICLAKGYLHSKALTDERFLITEKFGRIYKTGDQATKDATGNIIFLGRLDSQVKIRGYRIELGEIEVILQKLTNIPQSFAKAITLDGETFLCAYIKDISPEGIKSLRVKLKSSLPDYMFPTYILKIDSVPTTPSGKVDYKLLPLPNFDRPELMTEYLAPETQMQKQIASIWQRYLKVKAIGVNDSFFDVGGNSLLAIKILVEINQLEIKKLTIANFFQNPTIFSLSAFLTKDEDDLYVDDTVSDVVTSDIAIVAMTGRFPGASNVEEFWNNLIEGKNSINVFQTDQASSFISQELLNDTNYVFAQGEFPGQETFDAKFFGITPREAELMDPQQRKFLELSHEALELAGYDSETFNGIFAGMGNSKYPKVVDQYPDKIAEMGEFNVMLGLEKDYIATKVAYKLNLRGPALSIHTGCSTSLVAIIEAVKSLRLRHCEMALAGGISISGIPNTGHLFQEGGILSRNGACAPYDQSATGTVFTDGAGIVVLKRLEDAQKNGDQILVVIKGIGINNDGAHKMSFTAPSVNGQAEVILRAQKDAKIAADTIGMIEGHGTATPVGDPIEVEALTKAFRKTTANNNFCYLTSVKSNVGHLTAAAGVVGLIKTVLSVRNGKIPGTVHFKKENDHINLSQTPFLISSMAQDFPAHSEIRRAGVSSFGVGGTNAHVIIEEYLKEKVEKKLSNESGLFKVSAKNLEDLSKLQHNLVDLLNKTEESDWKKIAYTLDVGRKEYKFRSFLVVKNKEDLVKAKWSDSNSGKIVANPQVIFMFPGQGSQYIEMGKTLCTVNLFFKEQFDECCKILDTHFDFKIKDIIFNVENEALLSQTRYSQPAIFIVQYSLAMTLKTLGIKPSTYLGHSIGEFVAATISEVFSLEDGLKAIAKRAELMQSLLAGKMLSVATNIEKINTLISGFELDVAAINGNNSIVIAGEISEVDKFKVLLESEGIAGIELKTSHAFHSRMMKPAVNEYLKFLETLKINKPSAPFYSTVTTALESDLFSNASYWANHMLLPVRFTDTVTNVNENKNTIFIEIGTRNVLSQLVKKHLAVAANVVTTLGNNSASEAECLYKAFGQMWRLGLSGADKALLHKSQDQIRFPATTYPFAKTKYWLNYKNTSKKTEVIMSNASHSALETKLINIFEDASGMDVKSHGTETSFLEMGMDSLFLTQIALKIKKELKVTVSFRQLLEEYSTISLLSVFLKDKVTGFDEKKAAPAIIATPILTKAVSAPVVQAIPQASTFVGVPSIKLPQLSSSTSDVQGIINRQLELMGQQLQLLSGGAISTQIVTNVTAAPVMTQSEVKEEITTTEAAKKGRGADISKAKDSFGAQAKIIVEKNMKLSPAQLEEIKKFQTSYCAKTQQSKTFTQENRFNHADPRVVTGFKPEAKEVVYPIVVKKSYLQTLWDLDDNMYIDMTCGFGSNFFGNGNERIKKYVLKQLEEGIELGPQHPLVADVSRLVNELTGNERSAFCNTGSEAVLGAMRLARTVTGREKIIVFSGSYHGINDEVIIRGSMSGKSQPAAPGINDESVSNMIVLDYGTEESLKIIREMSADVAAVLVEPVQSRRSDFRPTEFLKEVRKITESTQTCLIFDEIITGFRINLAGAQGYYAIKADLCTYGKIVGGGMPIGVISGKAEYMDALDGGFWQYGDDSTPTVGVTYFAGTFVRHPLALAAAKGALEILKEGGAERLNKLNNMAQKFADDINQILTSAKVEMKFDNFGSLMKPKWKSDVQGGELFFAALRMNGVHVYDGFPWFVNLAHTEKDLSDVISAFRKSIEMMQELGIFPKSVTGKYITNGLMSKDHPPVPGAMIGRDEKGNPAWFMENKETGEFFLV